MKTKLLLFGKRFDMASRVRRRRLVVLFYAVFTSILVASWFTNRVGGGASFITIEFTILVGPLLGGYLSYSWGKSGPNGLVKPFGANEILAYSARKSRSALSRVFYPENADWGWTRNDEREINNRDHAHFLAYRVLSGLLGLAFIIDYLNVSSLHWLGVTPLVAERLIRGALQAGYILGLTLPTAILLWSEPDIEEEQ